MKSRRPCKAGYTLLCAVLLPWFAALNLNGQEPPPKLPPVESSASFWKGEVTVKGGCSAFNLDSDPAALSACLSVPASLSAGKLDLARQAAARLVMRLPENGVGHYWLGILDLKEEKFISALRHFQAAVDRSSKSPLAHLILGLCYAIMRQFELFKQEMVWLTQHAPNESLAYFYLGQYYSKDLDQVDKGMEYFTQALERNPNDIRSRYLLGYALELKGDRKRAMEEYEAAAAAAAAQGAVYSLPLQGSARLFLQEDNADQALEQVQKAIQLEPRLASNHVLLGKVYLRRGELDKGVSALKSATELNQTDAASYHLLFRTYLKLKMPAEAKWAQTRFEEVKQAYGEE
jgi:tetratricopeptide (TPR) repeat protein